jgi:hypothetical protein
VKLLGGSATKAAIGLAIDTGDVLIAE